MSNILTPFLAAGFLKDDVQKMKRMLSKKRGEPFSKIDISEKLKNLFEFFSSFSLTDEEIKRILVFAPEYILSKIEKIKANLNALSVCLNIPQSEVMKMVQKQPSLLSRKPENLIKNLNENASLIGVSFDWLLKTALKHPVLFSLTKSHVEKDKEFWMQRFSLSQEDFSALTMGAPVILLRDNKSILSHVNEMTTFFDVEENALIKAYLKTPTLFMCTPEMLKQKYDTYKKLYLRDVFRLGDNETTKDINLLRSYLLKSPTEALTNSMSGIEIRRIYGEHLKQRDGISSKAPIWKRVSKIKRELISFGVLINEKG